MSLCDEPFKRTKYCFVYCGPERCDCGASYIPFELPNIPPTRIEEKKGTEMITLNVTEAEAKVLYTLVSRQRSRYGLLKDQFDIDVMEDRWELNSLFEQLKAVKADQ